MKNFISWATISEKLTGSKTKIRFNKAKNKITAPSEYQHIVDMCEKFNKKLNSEIKKVKDNE